MADLDDFFAKKDKKKAKTSKPKFLTTEELVKNLEDTSKREAAAKPKKTEIIATSPVIETTNEAEISTAAVIEKPTAADDEWKEYEEEQRKDYSGLKIGKLQMNDDDDELSQDDDDEDGESDNNPNVDNGATSGGVSGPWKKVIPAEEVTQIIVTENEKRVYISPALRAAQGSASGVRRNRAAPDITNADFFPTLGAARPEEQRKKKNEPAFEEVKHGGRVQRVQAPQVAAPVSVANRFQGLDEDDS